MILYHATPKSNLKSIEANGLQPRRSTGKIKGVWLHTASRRHWAILHTMKRHRTESCATGGEREPKAHHPQTEGNLVCDQTHHAIQGGGY